MSNSLDSDQGRHSVGHGQGPNCLQSLSADNKSPVALRVQPYYGFAGADPGFLEMYKGAGFALLILSHSS